MGKISDALEKHQKERIIPLEKLREDDLSHPSTEETYDSGPVRIRAEDPEVTKVRKISSEAKFSESLVVLSSPDSTDAENFKLLRGQILFPLDREVPRSILVTSTFPGEGKTFTACNLAATIAMSVDEYV